MTLRNAFENIATEETLAEVRDRLPATPPAQPLTDGQLRATPVPIVLDAAALAALETTELGSATISAIGSAVGAAVGGGGGGGGIVEIGAASLAALETIELGATSLAALESISATGPLTDTQLRAAAVPVVIDAAALAALETTELGAATIAALTSYSALTDTQLRATAVPVSGTVELGATSLAAVESITAVGPLTDAQLRAAGVPVTGTFWQATQPVSGTVALDSTALAALTAAATPGTQPVSGPLTDAQLRATAVPSTLHTVVKGTAAAGDVTSSTASANRQPLDVSNYDPATGNANLWRPDAAPYIASEPTTLLFDNFETLDLTDTWTAGGTTPVVVNGTLTFPTGTAALAFSYLQSKPAFGLPASMFLRSGMLVALAAAAETGSKAWYGFGFPATTPTVALPLTNGVVIETDDTTGALVGVCYSNSVRGTPVTLVRPTDGLNHRIAVFYRSSRVYFEIDGVSGAANSIAFPNPAISKMPATIGLVNGAATLGAQRTFTSSLMSMADTGRNSTQLSDGLFQWRKATVKAASVPGAQTDTAFVVDTREGNITGQGSQTALNNNVVLAVAGTSAIDCAGYRSISLQVNPQAGTVTAGAITFEGSNDSTFTSSTPVPLYDFGSLTANPVTSYTIVAATNRFFVGALAFRYFRARISTGVTGTTTGVQAFTRITPETFYSAQQTVVQATAANLNITAALAAAQTLATLTTLTTLTTLANGQTAHSSASTGSPLRIGGKVKTAVDTTLVAADASDAAMTTDQALVIKPYAVPDLDWSYNAIPSGLANTTTPVTIKGAPAAGTRNYITSLNLSTDALGAATEFAIRDVAVSATSQTIASNILTTSTNHGWAIGDTVVPSASTVTGLTAGVAVYALTVPSAVTATFSATPGGSTLAISGTGVTATLNHYLLRLKLQISGIPVPTAIALPTPLKGGTALAQEMVTLTAATGGVYANLQGFIAV